VITVPRSRESMARRPGGRPLARKETRGMYVANDGVVAKVDAAVVVVVVDQGRECGYRRVTRSCRSLRDFSTSHD
jgi:hypothetical protein